MVRPAQTARSERTREALRQAALVRFLAQGVADTSAEQIAADAGVSLRTFYRHFHSKHDLLFADYTGLHWFRTALDARPADEPIIDSVRAAVFAFPYDVEAVTKIAALRGEELDPGASSGIFVTSRPTSPRQSPGSCNAVAAWLTRLRTSGCGWR
ncbi:bacterial regulatory s, tetR family protein [Mycobacterium kansasii]|uniref:Bacterial regulatory s, tetR family protein n=1 Tax=Mycobacterium kansasii TaxID=1768 RepID=A0A1V3WW58_MYCKA|nr:bacterial regulatory s, tetR family protein [Mycobacterium kansasii]